MLNITSTQFSISTQPDGIRELEHRVYFAKDLNGFLEEWNGQLTFNGSEYQYLRGQFMTGACGVIPVVINDGCGNDFKANLFLNEAEWRPDICSVRIGVVDDGFLSLIANNRKIKAYLNVPRSKNDIDISAYTTVQTDCQFLEFETGVDTPTAADRCGVRLYDAFKFLIAFMSDGEMDFDSTYFTNETDPADPTINRNPTLFDFAEITSGGATAYPYISFDELFSDDFKLYNVTFGVEKQANGRPLFRIETPEYFNVNLQAISMPFPDTITQNSEIESYYQKLIIGSAEVQSSHDYYDPQQLYSWEKEEYHLGGQCNSESILDMQLSTLITDTNLIQDALPISAGGTASESQHGKIALVILDGDNVTIPFDNPVNPSFQNFNFVLKNDVVLDRFYNAIPNSIFLFLGSGANDAESQIQSFSHPTQTAITSPFNNLVSVLGDFVKFPVEVSDPNNNMSLSTVAFQYDALTNTECTIYQAPVSAIYDVSFTMATNKPTASEFGFFAVSNGSVYLLTYPSASTTFEQIIPFGDNFLGGASAIPELQSLPYSSNGFMYKVNDVSYIEGSTTMFMNAGDRLVMMTGLRFSFGASEGYISLCSFKVNDRDTVARTFDPAQNYLLNTEFTYPVDNATWNDFLANRYGQVNVPYNNGTITGYLREATRNIETGRTEWKIRSKFTDA